MKKQTEIQKAIQQFMVENLHLFKEDPENLMKDLATLIGAFIRLGIFNGQDMLNVLLTHLVKNDLIELQEISEVEVEAMEEIADIPKNKLN